MADNKQSVLIVHNHYQIPGGEDTVVANEKKLLEDHGHKVVLYSRNNTELKEMSWIQKLCLPITTIFNPRTYWEVKKLIETEKIDIVHVHNTLNLVSPSVYYAGLAMKVPVVQTVHNFRLLCPGATFYRDGHICEDCVTHGLKCAVKHSCYRGSKVQTLACVISTCFHRLTGIYGKISYICLTEFNRQKLLAQKQIRSEQVYLKPNFVLPEIGTCVPYAERYNQYIFVGRIDKLKGIDILLEAWRIMGENAPKLLICGTGPMEDWCKQYIQDNQLGSVEMRGFVPNAEAKKLIAMSKALILPTQWYEGFPMTIVEAYSVGTPVFGSNMGNVCSVICQGLTGLCFSYNCAEKLAETIGCQSFDSNEIIEYFQTNYGKEANYQMLMECYQSSTREFSR